MKVLVTTASKHGATAEIADAIADTLRAAGHHVDLSAAADVESLDGYDAAVVGSAVYAGHWLVDAKNLVLDRRDDLRGRPVWLFSSGPIGDPPKPEEEAVDVAGVIEAAGAIGHQVFAGKLDRAKLGCAERAIVRALRAPEGDFRDWEQIRSWASSIAAHLDAVVPRSRGTASE